MKKYVLTFLMFLLLSRLVFADPLTGIYAIPGTLPTGFPTVRAAIAALNAQGATGGVTFNLAAGYSETFINTSDGLITTTTGSSGNQIIFRKSGTGANPVITAGTGTGTMDAIITFDGCDYVTFDGINLKENSANLSTTTQMEWGYAILKDATILNNGSQNITIKNCTVSLTVGYVSTIGIYSNNHTISSTSQLTIMDASGLNSNLKIYNDSIQNCYTGIYIAGYADATAPYAFYDQNNEIGKDGQNTITNVAGQASTGYGIYTIYQNNLKVANNKITSTMTGAGTPYGIFLTTANNASYELYGNYVSMQFSGGTGTTPFYPIWSEMGINGTTNTTNVYNNTVTACTNTKVTSANTYYLNLQNLGVTASVYGNSITNNVTGSSSVTAIGTIRYLYIQHNPTNNGPCDVHDNTLTGNVHQQSVVGGSGSTYFIYMNGKATVNNVYNNIISNNTIAGATGTTYYLYASFDIGAKNVYNNTITHNSKSEGTSYCLYLYNVTSNSGTTNVYQNTVSDIEGVSGTVNIYGIYASTSGNLAYCYNNMISDLRAPGATTSSFCITGIYNSSATLGLYNNTIYLTGTSTNTNFGTTAVYVGTSSYTIDLRNNILVNAIIPKGTGKTSAIRFSSTTLTNFVSASNYNVLFAGTPGASNLIYYNGTNGDQYLNDYKNRVFPRELQSVTELPPFVNTNPTTMNVHLRTDIATQCESGGFVVSTPVAITTDFDNNWRYPNLGYPVNGSNFPNAPDIGADEIGGIPNDLTAPAITYTPFGNINNTSNRTLTATITDGTGVPIATSALPVLYWKKNSGAYIPAQGTWVSGSTYTFTFGAGTSIGDVVSYYIVAQDNVSTPNAGAFPFVGASGFTTSPPACSTPPTSPSTYTVLANIAGIFHVGTGKDYTTLTAAIADINAKYIGGPVTLLLDDPTYNGETCPMTLNPNPGSSATNTLTIRPNAGNTPAFSYALTTSGILILNGFDYLTIDGSNSGSSSRDLTFVNTSTGNANAYVFSITNNGGSDPATNITIKNCILKCTPTAVTGGTVVKFSSTGGGWQNFIFDNNTITGGQYGIFLTGTSTNIASNCQIINNTIGSTHDNEAIISVNVYVTYADNILISNNEIMGVTTNGIDLPNPPTGIYISTGSTNTKISKNMIHDLYHYADDGWGACGINYASDATTVTEISDNVIYNLKSPGINPGVGQNIVYGMFFKSGGNVKILHNSVNLTGAWLSQQYDASSACIGFYYQATGGNFEVRNNIFRNGQTLFPTGSGNTYGRAFGIMISLDPSLMFSTIDNNDYFIDGQRGSIAQQYTNGTGNIVVYGNLLSWQNYTGKEASSLNVNPSFTSDSYLYPLTNQMPHSGSYVSLVPTDILNVNRTNPPDMGAYEFSPNPLLNTLSATVISNSYATLNGNANAAGSTFNLFFDYGLTSAYGTTVTATPATVTGISVTSTSAYISGLTSGTTYHFRARGVTSAGLTVYGNDLTFVTATTPAKVLNLSSIFFEGLYNGNSTMFEAKDVTRDLEGNITGVIPKWGDGIADQITVELHASTTHYDAGCSCQVSDYPTIVYSATNIPLSTTGTAIVSAIPPDNNGSYYLTIKQRNSIETTSALPVSFSGSTISYAFNALSQAYDGNMTTMLESDGVTVSPPLIYGGDVNQDRQVEAEDMNDVGNDASVFVYGYTATDVYGDGQVESADINITGNNASAFVYAHFPM